MHRLCAPFAHQSAFVCPPLFNRPSCVREHLLCACACLLAPAQQQPAAYARPVTIARQRAPDDEEATRPAATFYLLHALRVTPILILARATLEAVKLLLLRLASLLFCAAAADDDDSDTHTNKPRADHETVTSSSTTAARDRSPHAAPHASTTGSSFSTPLLVLTGLSAMRDAEPTTSTASTTTVAHRPTQILLRTSYSSVSESENMTIRHDANGHNASSASSSNSVRTTTASSSTSGTGDKTQQDPTDAITSPVLSSKGNGRRVKPFSGLDDGATAQTTRSLTSQHDLVERRSSFCSMAADSRAQLRRRSHDFTDFTSMSVPPPGSSTGFLQTRSKNHGHMRVYGRSDTETNKTVTARQEEGAALVDVVIPSTRTIWRRGQPVCIEWRVLDENVDTVAIELMEEGSSATTTIAQAAANSGFYTYPRVPWGMQCGPTYFLRISSTADPSRYMTTSFFQIGSAP